MTSFYCDAAFKKQHVCHIMIDQYPKSKTTYIYDDIIAIYWQPDWWQHSAVLPLKSPLKTIHSSALYIQDWNIALLNS